MIKDGAKFLAGQTVGPYEILNALGAGGMGEVYLAKDTRLNRQIALKFLSSRFTADENRVHRFKREALAASTLNHPNIITIHEIGSLEGVDFIATEFVDGVTLRQRIEGGRLEFATSLDIALQIGGALAAAHEAGIVHRDVKPENVMVRHDGYVKVLDFGLAKLIEPSSPADDSQVPTATALNTEIGAVVGTPRYMSPEQARGGNVDARTDIFSLGSVLYEMIAGRAPFAGVTTSDVIASILKDEPPPFADFAPEAPRELERIVRKTLRKDREERYQTIKDLLNDLKDLKKQLMIGDLGLRTAEAKRRSQPSEHA